MPAVGMYSAVVSSNGQALAQGIVDGAGRFSLSVAEPLRGTEILVFLATATDGNNQPVLSVLKPAAGGEPGSVESAPWAWQVAVPASGSVGKITITEEQGSGAMFIYLINLAGLGAVIDDMLGGDVSKV